MSLETDRIEADLNESRHRLNDTLSALGDRLSPGQILDEGLGLVQGQAGEFAKKLGSQMKENPMPTVLIAAGIAWFIYNQRQSKQQHHSVSADEWHAEHHYRSIEEARWSTPRMANESDEDYEHRVHKAYADALGMKERVGEAAHEFKERVSKTVQGIRSRAESSRRRLGEMFSDATHSAARAAGRAKEVASEQIERLGQTASAARHGAADFYTETPLAVGAIALAIGALVGGAAPLSQTEREGLRGLADTAARKGADLAERGAQMVQERVDGAMH